MSRQVFQSPSKYVQGRNEIEKLPEHASNLGKAGAFLIVGPRVITKYEERLTGCFKKSQLPMKLWEFKGECSKVEIDRIVNSVQESKFDVIVGVGGGKVLDTAKAVAYFTSLPVIIVPTAASSDAPCSALSVLYTEDHIFDRYLILKQNPDVVVMDLDLIATAPVRLLVAGIGDALATYFEARQCFISKKKSMAGGECSVTALALAKACFDTLLADGHQAVLSATSGVVTPAFVNVVEANTLLSGLGFESGGLAAAHAVHNGMTAIKETHEFLHGEKVAFGTIVQLVLEHAPEQELKQVIEFCKLVGLPTTLTQLGVKEVTKELLMPAAQLACAETESIHNMTRKVTPEDVVAAMIVANELGK
ncbi:putative glycerol dehydrogenase [Monocercomonoides exilis]|uniref:putative glycerol dehydrogenase n=1 Tax=Monocercomonoides exilis TaxID=2049356 RepID=UPI00355AB386|nr:putative glycerol dehydrogenase [Monocercomonoides exilis]|eukprot:MONOS_13050.1-p1 / transcript=MONOS_13050.1 / gene=MONOS_13050 / organism=Monocercomonoides_exilis_PA203 / gene_product=glycerol dehydrogenase / transcript_product=glycerol dehydrogenase / location=Mono_scaffold00772:3293-4381(-) / protein_length=363 / sequence_SO=supercontig / SO=protein_coding / is_pseudo=false